MAEYQLTSTDMVLRAADQAYIPNDPLNADRIAYDKWITEGGVPDPYVPLEPPPPQVTPETQLFYDHENRLRVIEGVPPLTMQDILIKLTVPT